MASPIELASRYRTGQEQPQTRKGLELEVYQKSAPSAGELSPVMNLMKSNHRRTARASLLLLRARQ